MLAVRHVFLRRRSLQNEIYLSNRDTHTDRQRDEVLPLQLQWVLHSLVVGLLYQLLLEVTDCHALCDDGVH